MHILWYILYSLLCVRTHFVPKVFHENVEHAKKCGTVKHGYGYGSGITFSFDNCSKCLSEIDLQKCLYLYLQHFTFIIYRAYEAFVAMGSATEYYISTWNSPKNTAQQIFLIIGAILTDFVMVSVISHL